MREVIAAALESVGWSATPAGSLEAAQGALGEEPFSLIVLDLRLPDGDGLDFLSRLRSDPALAGTLGRFPRSELPGAAG